jgi:hypothetical protein
MMGALSKPQAQQHSTEPPAVRMGGMERAVHTVRSHLGMDVGFVCEFVGN